MNFLSSLSSPRCDITPEKVLYSQPKFKMLLIKSDQLSNMNLLKPECQRAIDHEQINSIFTFQVRHYEDYRCFFFTNPITIAEFNNVKYILDGQHRIQCISLLNQKYDEPFDILVSMLYVDSKEEIDEKYIAINQNKPVPLPSNINDWKSFTRFIDEYFQNNYSKYFSKAERSQLPNFNKELLLKYLNDNNIAEKMNYDYKLFLTEIEELNLFYLQTYTSTLSNFKFNVMNSIEKAKRKHPSKPFVLGIFRKFEWVDRIVYKTQNNVNYINMNHISTDTRIKIKSKLRKSVWTKFHKDSMIGHCNVCEDIIDYDNFQCGHIQSVFYNGRTMLHNLVPICGKCNLDMGIKNLDEYKKELMDEMGL